MLRGVVSSPFALSSTGDALRFGSLLAHMSAPEVPRSGAFPVADDTLTPESADTPRAWPSSPPLLSPFARGCGESSSSTASTLRSFDSDLRGWCVKEDEEDGCECLLLSPGIRGTDGGDAERVGEVAPELGDEVGGGEEGMSAHAAVSGKKPPLLDHEFLLDGSPSLSSSGVVADRGLGAEDGLAITDRGGRMLKI